MLIKAIINAITKAIDKVLELLLQLIFYQYAKNLLSTRKNTEGKHKS